MRIFLDANILFPAAFTDGLIRSPCFMNLSHHCRSYRPNRSIAKIPAKLQLPDKDIPVLAGAIHARCDSLMTGDSRHFGQLFGRTVGGVSIRSAFFRIAAIFLGIIIYRLQPVYKKYREFLTGEKPPQPVLPECNERGVAV